MTRESIIEESRALRSDDNKFNDRDVIRFRKVRPSWEFCERLGAGKSRKSNFMIASSNFFENEKFKKKPSGVEIFMPRRVHCAQIKALSRDWNVYCDFRLYLCFRLKARIRETTDKSCSLEQQSRGGGLNYFVAWLFFGSAAKSRSSVLEKVYDQCCQQALFYSINFFFFRYLSAYYMIDLLDPLQFYRNSWNPFSQQQTTKNGDSN